LLTVAVDTQFDLGLHSSNNNPVGQQHQKSNNSSSSSNSLTTTTTGTPMPAELGLEVDSAPALCVGLIGDFGSPGIKSTVPVPRVSGQHRTWVSSATLLPDRQMEQVDALEPKCLEQSDGSDIVIHRSTAQL
jgi:hypothetical protein